MSDLLPVQGADLYCLASPANSHDQSIYNNKEHMGLHLGRIPETEVSSNRSGCYDLSINYLARGKLTRPDEIVIHRSLFGGSQHPRQAEDMFSICYGGGKPFCFSLILLIVTVRYIFHKN